MLGRGQSQEILSDIQGTAGAYVTLVRIMGLNPQQGDIETRKKLLDFSITHCPPEEVVSLLQSNKLLASSGTYLGVSIMYFAY